MARKQTARITTGRAPPRIQQAKTNHHDHVENEDAESSSTHVSDLESEGHPHSDSGSHSAVSQRRESNSSDEEEDDIYDRTELEILLNASREAYERKLPFINRWLKSCSEDSGDSSGESSNSTAYTTAEEIDQLASDDPSVESPVAHLQASAPIPPLGSPPPRVPTPYPTAIPRRGEFEIQTNHSNILVATGWARLLKASYV